MGSRGWLGALCVWRGARLRLAPIRAALWGQNLRAGLCACSLHLSNGERTLRIGHSAVYSARECRLKSAVRQAQSAADHCRRVGHKTESARSLWVFSALLHAENSQSRALVAKRRPRACLQFGGARPQLRRARLQLSSPTDGAKLCQLATGSQSVGRKCCRLSRARMQPNWQGCHTHAACICK